MATPTSITPAAAAKPPLSPGQAAIVEMQVRVGAVISMLGFLPSEVQGILRAHFYDWLTHHRLSVMKNHGLTGGRQAQKWLATRLFRYTKANDPRLPANVKAEAFAADVDDFRPGQMKLLEEGGIATSSELMFTPVWGKGRTYAKARQMLDEALKTRKTDLIRSSNGKILIVQHIKGSRNGRGMRDLIIGVGTRRQRYKPTLGFRARFDAVSSKHVAAIGKDLDRAGTEAGLATLETKGFANRVYNQTFASEARRYLTAHPGNFAMAAKVAKAAARNARTQYTKASRAGGVD